MAPSPVRVAIPSIYGDEATFGSSDGGGLNFGTSTTYLSSPLPLQADLDSAMDQGATSSRTKINNNSINSSSAVQRTTAGVTILSATTRKKNDPPSSHIMLQQQPSMAPTGSESSRETRLEFSFEFLPLHLSPAACAGPVTVANRDNKGGVAQQFDAADIEPKKEPNNSISDLSTTRTLTNCKTGKGLHADLVAITAVRGGQQESPPSDTGNGSIRSAMPKVASVSSISGSTSTNSNPPSVVEGNSTPTATVNTINTAVDIKNRTNDIDTIQYTDIDSAKSNSGKRDFQHPVGASCGEPQQDWITHPEGVFPATNPPLVAMDGHVINNNFGGQFQHQCNSSAGFPHSLNATYPYHHPSGTFIFSIDSSPLPSEMVLVGNQQNYSGYSLPDAGRAPLPLPPSSSRGGGGVIGVVVDSMPRGASYVYPLQDYPHHHQLQQQHPERLDAINSRSSAMLPAGAVPRYTVNTPVEVSVAGLPTDLLNSSPNNRLITVNRIGSKTSQVSPTTEEFSSESWRASEGPAIKSIGSWGTHFDNGSSSGTEADAISSPGIRSTVGAEAATDARPLPAVTIAPPSSSPSPSPEALSNTRGGCGGGGSSPVSGGGVLLNSCDELDRNITTVVRDGADGEATKKNNAYNDIGLVVTRTKELEKMLRSLFGATGEPTIRNTAAVEIMYFFIGRGHSYPCCYIE